MVAGLLAGLGVVLHVLEGFLPPPVPLPGVKVGFANVVTLVALFLFGGKEAFCVSLFRIVLGNLLSGTFFGVAFFLSLGGGMSSFAVMYLARNRKLPPLWVSVFGALSHSLGQWAVAFWYVQSRGMLLYLPVLLVCALPAGVFVGYLGGLLLTRGTLLKT